jgi:hypothetical protein
MSGMRGMDQRTASPRPDFGLSGAVRRLNRVFPPLIRVFGPSIPTRSLRVLHRRLRSGSKAAPLPVIRTIE